MRSAKYVCSPVYHQCNALTSDCRWHHNTMTTYQSDFIKTVPSNATSSLMTADRWMSLSSNRQTRDAIFPRVIDVQNNWKSPEQTRGRWRERWGCRSHSLVGQTHPWVAFRHVPSSSSSTNSFHAFWSELLTGREDARGWRQSVGNERGKHAAEGAAEWRAAMKHV